MTIAQVGTLRKITGPTGGTSSSLDTTGATLLVLTYGGNTSPAPNISDSKGNTWILARSEDSGSTRLYYAKNPIVGTGHTFTVGTPGGNIHTESIITAWSGVKTSSDPLDQQNGANGISFSNPAQPGSITPTENNELIITNSRGMSPVGSIPGYTIIDNDAGAGGDHHSATTAYQIQTTATATNPAYTDPTGTAGAIIVVSFKAAAVAPEAITNIRWWLDADDVSTFTLSGSDITQWNDKSGNAQHAVAASSGSAPTRNGSQNGRTTVLHPAAAYALGKDPTTVPISQPFTVFIVCRATGTAFARILDNGNSTQIIGRNGSNDNLEWDNSNGVTNTLEHSNYHILTGVYNGASSKQRIDRSQVGTGNPGSIDLSSMYRIGWLHDGEYAEVIIYSRELTSTEIDNVESYLNTKWISSAVNITGTGGTVLSVAGTGPVGGQANVNGTSGTVLVFAGVMPGAQVDITGTGATVLVEAGKGFFTVGTPDPIKIADRGIRNSIATGNAVITLTNPTLIAVGNYLVARISVENSGASGALPGLSITDARNSGWTIPTGANQDPGAASAGTSCYLAYKLVNTPYQAGDTITFTWTTGTPRSAIVIEEWANIDRTTPAAVAATQANNVSSTAQPAVSRTPTAAGQLMYVVCAAEQQGTEWGAQDTDTTAGSWVDVTKDAANTGTHDTSQAVYGGYKIVTGTSAQTWNNTLSVVGDWAAIGIVFAKAPPDAKGVAGIVSVFAGTGQVTGQANITGTSGIVTVVAGTGQVTGQANITGTSATVLVFAGTGVVQTPVNITGTSGTVLSFAGTGVVTGNASVTGTSGTVLVFAGTGTISATTNISGTSATVLVFAGTGSIGVTTNITGTSGTVLSVAGTGIVDVGLTGISGTVLSFAGTGVVTGHTNITGTSATVNSVAGTGIISVNILGTGGTVASFAGTGQITATTPVTGVSGIVAVTAGTGTIIVGADIVGNPGTVYVFAGTGTISATTNITGTSAVVTVTAGTGTISIQITGTGGVVASFAGIGQISGHTSINGITATVIVIAGIGPVARIIPPAKQGAILVM